MNYTLSRNPVLRSIMFLLLILGALINIVPFIWMVSTSLKVPSQVFAYPPKWIPEPVAWANYAKALLRVNGRVFFNSFLFSGTVVFLQGLLATMGAYAFSRLRFRFRDQLFLLYLGTMMVPTQVTMIPTFMVVVKLGWINTFQGLVLPIVAQGAFGTFLFRQFFMRIPEELYEAARMDGASHWHQYFHLTLPLSRPALTAYGVVTFLTAWNMYLWPLIVVRSPEMKLVTTVIAELSGALSQDRAVSMAAVTLSTLPVLLLYVVGQKWFVEGISMSGIKG
jgi:multiple sugar transport system permease protein